MAVAYGSFDYETEITLPDAETEITVITEIQCTAKGMPGNWDPVDGGYPSEAPEFEFLAFYTKLITEDYVSLVKVKWGTLSDAIGPETADALFDDAVDAAIQSRDF